MTEIHAQLVGDKVVMPRLELERLVELAQRSEDIKLQIEEVKDCEIVTEDEDDVPTQSLMLLAEHGGAFDWLTDEEDLYTVEDLKVRYK